jgi:pyruvate,water dikinase
VIRSKKDLSDFQRGEILVCDAIDPAMTFIVPLAAGIVERRGGMLIHGAIIAREYGIPCVSGIAAAADIINTGDRLTIDGHLGLVFFPPNSGQLTQTKKDHLLRKELDDAS